MLERLSQEEQFIFFKLGAALSKFCRLSGLRFVRDTFIFSKALRLQASSVNVLEIFLQEAKFIVFKLGAAFSKFCILSEWR